MRQDFLDGLPVRAVHVSRSRLNPFWIGQALQEFNDGLLVPVLHHIDQAAVANVGDDASWPGKVDFIQPRDDRRITLVLLLHFGNVLAKDGPDGLFINADLLTGNLLLGKQPFVWA